MVCQKKKSHDAPLCLTCTLHVIIVLCLAVSTRGLHMAQAQHPVEISPVEPTVLSGTNFTLTCSISQSSSILAKDIKWNHDGMTLPAELYSALDDKRSQLTIHNAGFQDSGHYTCVATTSLDVSSTTQVYVGVVPTKATDLSCFSRDFVDVTCEWEQGRDTNINTTYTLQFYLPFENPEWDSCQPETCSCRDDKACTLEGVLNEKALLRVNSSNKLGNASSEEAIFDHETETVPYPPGNVAVKAMPRFRLNVTWDVPRQWRHYYASQLQYKLEYYKKGSAVLMEYPRSPLVGKNHTELPSPESLNAYTKYCVRVAAKISEGPWSDWSEQVCNRTLEGKPDAMVNVTWRSTVSAKNDNLRDVVIEWKPLPKSNMRGKILGYRVVRVNSTRGISTTLNSSETSFEIEGLERYISYRYTIEAFNSVGSSPRSYFNIIAEQRPPPSVALVIVVAFLGVAAVLGLFAFGWCCIKYYRLLKPVPNISFIDLDRFETVVNRSARRNVAEREVFDEPLGHHTPNGSIPNGTIHGNFNSHAGGTAACNAKDGEEDYVKLREQAGPEESFPLLCSNSGVESCSEKGNSCRKLSEASADSANSTDMSSDRDPDSPGSTVEPSGKFAKLYVPTPPPVSLHLPHTGLGQPRLDSTDSGFGDNCIDYRLPNYTKLSTIPSDSSSTEVPANSEHDAESDGSSEDVYHRLGNSGPAMNNMKPLEDKSHEPGYSEPRMPSYTRLSSLPGPLINGIVPSVGEGHLTL